MKRSMTVRAIELQRGDLAALLGVVVKIRKPVLSASGLTVEVTWPPQGMVESGMIRMFVDQPVAIEREV